MTELLRTVAIYSNHNGYAERADVVRSVREYPHIRTLDDAARALLKQAVGEGLLDEIGKCNHRGPGYVLTRKGQERLTRALQRERQLPYAA